MGRAGLICQFGHIGQEGRRGWMSKLGWADRVGRVVNDCLRTQQIALKGKWQVGKLAG